MREMVAIAVAAAIPQDQIALLVKHPATGLPIGETSLKKYFAPELRDGSTTVRWTHAMSLLKAVREGNVTAMIWWDKTRNRIGANFRAGDQGEDHPSAPPIAVDQADIVVVARRVAFVLAQGAHKAKAEKPPKAITSK